ncbi:MAG: ATP-dependent dethiobiotin synthetase BioD [Acidimicrobiales bacterium]
MLVVCTGTATEIGKTWVGAAVLRELRAAGVSVAARKPAQSFDPETGAATDAAVLAHATGETPAEVCPEHRWYPVPMAPPMAAATLGLPAIALSDLLAETTWPDVAVRWLETVGGPRSPLADDGDTVDVCDVLRPDLVVLVADAGLGTINAVRLALSALATHPVAVYLNRYDGTSELHRRNLAWLADLHPLVDPADLAKRVQCSI